MKLSWRIGLYILLLTLVIGASGLVSYLCFEATRPTLERNGGTALVYELDEERLAPGYQAEAMAAAIQRRVDPSGIANITARPAEKNRGDYP